MTVEILQARIQLLENENRRLKERLEEAGISCTDIENYALDSNSALYDPDQGGRIKSIDVTNKVAETFFELFCSGRRDVYDLRYTNPKTGRNGYYTQCHNRWNSGCHKQKRDGVLCKNCDLRSYKYLATEMLMSHMKGKDSCGNDVVAIYPMLENNMCQLLVFDFDNHAKGAEQDDYANVNDFWKEEVNALSLGATKEEIDLINDEIVKSSINNIHSPDDLAWAMMQ